MAKLNLFNIFSRSSNKHDIGVTKKEAKFDGKYNIKNFFRFYKRNFNSLVKANLMFALLCIPLLCLVIPLMGWFNTEAYMPTNMIYPVVQGIAQYGTNGAINTYQALYGGTTVVSVWSDTSYIIFYCSALVALTYGFANVGMAYITRSAVQRKHIYPWSDFFYSVKRNFKQALGVGIFDVIVTIVLAYDILAYNSNRTEFFLKMFYFLIILIAAIWLIMRSYIYPMIVTFDLSFYKLLKNSLIFTVLGIKRNVWILLGYLGGFFFTFYSIIILQTVGYVFPFIFTIGFCSFLNTYSAWPIINEYMIKPYYPEVEDEDENSDGEEAPVFSDRG